MDVNSRVGPLTQFYPARLTIFLDRLAHNLLARLSRVSSLRHRFTGWGTGYYRG